MNYSKEWITKQEFNDIINHPDISRRDELIISCLYWCALRVSELSNLKVKDIDIKNSNLILWLSKKSDHSELIPIPAHLIKQISQWVKENNLKLNNYLVKSQKSKKLSRIQIYRIIKNKAENMKLNKKITTHTFRRSRATHLLDAGLPIEKVSRLLRHNRLESTMTYLTIEYLKKDIEEIDQNYSEKQEKLCKSMK